MEQVGGDHYKSEYQHWDWAIDVGLGPLEYGATRYICRHWKKDGVEDLKKAKHFLWKLKNKGSRYRNQYMKCRPKYYDNFHTERFCKENDIPKKEALLLDILTTWTNRHNLSYANIILDELITSSEMAASGQTPAPGGKVAGAGATPSPAPAVCGAGGADAGDTIVLASQRTTCPVCGGEDTDHHVCGEPNK